MVNKVFLLGNVGTEPQLGGNDSSRMASFPLATSERFSRNNEQQELTEWHRIVVYGNLASFVSQHIVKGMQIYIEGKLHTRLFKDRNGIERQVTEIVAKDIKLCGKKEK